MVLRGWIRKSSDPPKDKADNDDDDDDDEEEQENDAAKKCKVEFSKNAWCKNNQVRRSSRASYEGSRRRGSYPGLQSSALEYPEIETVSRNHNGNKNNSNHNNNHKKNYNHSNHNGSNHAVVSIRPLAKNGTTRTETEHSPIPQGLRLAESKAKGSSRDSSERVKESTNRNSSENGTETKKLKPMKLQFWKTKMCPWLKAMGNCRKGSNCRYAHLRHELRPLPDLTKTKMCEEFIVMGRCSTSDSCKYAHSVEELRATTSFSKTKLCPLWLHGDCIAGAECRFAHGKHELRKTVTDQHNNKHIDNHPSGPENYSQKRKAGNVKVHQFSRGQTETHQPPCPVPSIQHSPLYKETRGRMDYLPTHPESDFNERPRYYTGSSGFDFSVPYNQHGSMKSCINSRPSTATPFHNHQHHPTNSPGGTTGDPMTMMPLATMDNHRLEPPYYPMGQAHNQSPYHHQQGPSPFVDPAILFQGLSPVSLRVATNALVYLSESHHNNWQSENVDNSSSLRSPMAMAPPQHHQHEHAPSSGTAGPITYYASTDSHQRYAQVLYRHNSPMHHSTSHWDATASTHHGGQHGSQYLQRSTNHQPGSPVCHPSVLSNPQTSSNQILTHHVASPMHFYTHPNFASTPIPHHSAGFSPVGYSVGPAAGETGRFVTTHLLPAGMLSPVDQQFHSHGTEEALVQSGGRHLDRPTQQQPFDHLFLSFPTPTAFPTSTESSLRGSPFSATPMDERERVCSDGSVVPQKAEQAGEMISQQRTPPFQESPSCTTRIHASTSLTIGNPQLLAWSHVMAQPHLLSAAPPHGHNRNSQSIHAAPTVFHSPHTQYQPSSAATCSVPMISTTQCSASSMSLPALEPPHRPCLPPFHPPRSFSSYEATASPKSTALSMNHRTLTFAVGTPNRVASESTSPPSVIAEFPVNVLSLSSRSQTSKERHGRASIEDEIREESQQLGTDTTHYCLPDDTNQHYQQQPHASLSSPLEYSPSLLSSKSSSEGTSTGSPLPASAVVRTTMHPAQANKKV